MNRRIGWTNPYAGTPFPERWEAGLGPLSGGGRSRDPQAPQTPTGALQCCSRSIDSLLLNCTGNFSDDFLDELQSARGRLGRRDSSVELFLGGTTWKFRPSKCFHGKPIVLASKHVEIQVQPKNKLMRIRFLNHALWNAGPIPGLNQVRRLAREAFPNTYCVEVAEIDLAADFVNFNLRAKDRTLLQSSRGTAHSLSVQHDASGVFTGFLVGSRQSARHGRIYDKTRELEQNPSKRDRLSHYPDGPTVTRVEVCFKRKRIEHILDASDPASVFRHLDRLWADGVGPEKKQHGWIRLVGRKGNVTRRWKVVQGVKWPELEDAVRSALPPKRDADPEPQLFGIARVVAARRLQGRGEVSLDRILEAISDALVDQDSKRARRGKACLLDGVRGAIEEERPAEEQRDTLA
tara:strand:- start:2522 stop:3739 length:1218 start_codon:yes stop_codon:yes gene_type:complete